MFVCIWVKRGKQMKLAVDPDRCQGHARCCDARSARQLLQHGGAGHRAGSGYTAGDLGGPLRADERRRPVGHLADSVDIANVVAFLASEQAAYISGRAIIVDSAFTVRLPATNPSTDAAPSTRAAPSN